MKSENSLFPPDELDMLFFEKQANLRGFFLLAGVDEAGRGPLAGPVVACALILPDNLSSLPKGINDSKKLTAKRREKYYEELLANDAVAYGVGISQPSEIDEVNILNATHKAMARAVLALGKKVDFCLVDGLPVKGLPVEHEAIVKGDSRSLSIAAASIIAKETRDRLMVDMAKKYPQYGFEKHKGYGTKLHMEALNTYGPCEEHRYSFAPVRLASERKNSPCQEDLF